MSSLLLRRYELDKDNKYGQVEPPTSKVFVAEGPTLVIDALALTGTPAEVALEAQNRGVNVTATTMNMLHLGATVLQHGSSQATVDSVASEVDRLVATVSELASSRMAEQFGAHARAIGQTVSRYFDADSAHSVQAEIRQLLADAARNAHREVVAVLADTAGPLTNIKSELTTELGAKLSLITAQQTQVVEHLGQLAEAMRSAKALAQERARGTAKGGDFESVVHAIVEASFAPYEDIVYDVTCVAGATGAKAGDFVAVLNPSSTRGEDRRVVIEAKCQRLSLPRALAELDAAMDNRDADVGILVFAGPSLAPIKGQCIRVYPENRIIVVIDEEAIEALPLEVACHLARALALSLAVASPEHASLARISDVCDRLTAVIEDGKSISRGAATARKGIELVEGAFEQLRSKALGLIAEINGEVAA